MGERSCQIQMQTSVRIASEKSDIRETKEIGTRSSVIYGSPIDPLKCCLGIFFCEDSDDVTIYVTVALVLEI